MPIQGIASIISPVTPVTPVNGQSQTGQSTAAVEPVRPPREAAEKPPAAQTDGKEQVGYAVKAALDMQANDSAEKTGVATAASPDDIDAGTDGFEEDQAQAALQSLIDTGGSSSLTPDKGEETNVVATSALPRWSATQSDAEMLLEMQANEADRVAQVKQEAPEPPSENAPPAAVLAADGSEDEQGTMQDRMQKLEAEQGAYSVFSLAAISPEAQQGGAVRLTL